jgi:hypothetical protein
MQQVLEAPEYQDEERHAIAIEDGDSAAEPTRQPASLLRAIVSVFTRPRSRHLPTHTVVAKPRYESAVDRLCRIDPYLYIRAISV